MLEPTQAKKKFRSTLALFLSALLWPLAACLLNLILAIVGLKSLGIIIFLSLFVWLVLFVWLFVQLWQIAKEVGTTPWATLWLLLPIAGFYIVGMLFLEPLKYQADNKPENQRLPLSWSLLKESWKFYVENFKACLKTSIWYLYMYFVMGAITAGFAYWRPALAPYVILILLVPAAFYVLWIMLNLFFQMSLIESGQTPGQTLKDGLRKYLSYLWIMVQAMFLAAGPFLLACLVVVAFTLLLGGWQSVVATILPEAKTQPGLVSMSITTIIVILAACIILMVPTWLWLMYKSAIWNTLALPVMLRQDKKGFAVLKECDRIAKKRWWGIFWKNQLAGIMFGAYSMLISLGMSIAASLLAFILIQLHANTVVGDFLGQAMNGITQMIVMPLFVAFSLKLYKAFSRTAE